MSDHLLIVKYIETDNAFYERELMVPRSNIDSISVEFSKDPWRGSTERPTDVWSLNIRMRRGNVRINSKYYNRPELYNSVQIEMGIKLIASWYKKPTKDLELDLITAL